MAYVDVRYSDELEKPDQFLLLTPMPIEIVGYVFTIPAGFVSDGASVPRWLWSLFPPIDNRTLRAYILHDYLYTHWEEFAKQLPTLAEVDDPRRLADQLMLITSDEGKGSQVRLRNVLFYWMVRLAGEKNWRTFRQQAQTN